jgi:peptidoglycan hydrolase-like protein with peptidoglycan-binding domain
MLPQRLEAGPIDGVAGQRTAEAVRKFQQATGQPVSGRIDEPTARKLGL